MLLVYTTLHITEQELRVFVTTWTFLEYMPLYKLYTYRMLIVSKVLKHAYSLFPKYNLEYYDTICSNTVHDIVSCQSRPERFRNLNRSIRHLMTVWILFIANMLYSLTCPISKRESPFLRISYQLTCIEFNTINIFRIRIVRS